MNKERCMGKEWMTTAGNDNVILLFPVVFYIYMTQICRQFFPLGLVWKLYFAKGFSFTEKSLK